MSKILVLLFLGIFFTSNVFAEKSHHRGGAEFLNKEAYSIKADTSLFSSTAIFDQDGKDQALADGDSFTMLDANFKISYGLSPKIEPAIFLKLRSVKAQNQSFSESNSGPESLGAECKFLLGTSGRIHYAFGVHYLQTLYTNTVYSNQISVQPDTIILGDDGKQYGVSLFTTYNNHPWKVDTTISYVSPPNNLSSEIDYKFEGQYFFSKLSLLGGVEGIYSLESNKSVQRPWQARGPTNIFNSYNRQTVAPYIGLNFMFDNVLLSLKGQSVFSGQSTDKGNLIGLGLSWSSTGITEDSKIINSFKEYHIEASVLKVSARGNFIKIDQGLATDVEKGAKFDIYQTDYFGGNILVGAGVVYDVGADWAVIKLSKKFNEINIKPGFAARGY